MRSPKWIVGANAHVDHYQIQEFSAESSVVHSLQVHQSHESHFDTHTTTLKAGLLRNNLTIVPDAEYCEKPSVRFRARRRYDARR